MSTPLDKWKNGARRTVKVLPRGHTWGQQSTEIPTQVWLTCWPEVSLELRKSILAVMVGTLHREDSFGAAPVKLGKVSPGTDWGGRIQAEGTS